MKTPAWNSFSTDGPCGVTAAITSIPGHDGIPLHVYYARPTGAGPHPAIIAVHHLPGWDEFYQEFCERLARHGFAVIAPDLYCRIGHGDPDDVAAKARAGGGVHDDDVVAECAAVLEWVQQQPDITDKVGIIGSCSGGRHAVLTASRLSGFSAVVDLWGGGVVATPDQLSPARPVPPVKYTSSMNAPLLGLFGNEDKSPSSEEVDVHESELQRLSKSYEFHRYDGAGHGFFYYHKPAYRPNQAMDGWQKVFEFFHRNLSRP